ncbi:MAG: HAD-IB family phosphatase [Candidatus ainarchaeum sp.]|nr:HAD-IB family phosphatase [Candidatus ainarchaeum sp.]
MASRISVVIPALNEEATIREVIAIARHGDRKREVIVVDDNSSDNTAKFAKAAGAKVIESAILGKGKSMQEGLSAAKGDIVVFLDADLRGLNPDVVSLVTRPIVGGECDFVKARYARESGRVTEILAKPLLKMLFPGMKRFEQPLGGVIAGRRELLVKLDFENDYGVDIGILIDVINLGARTMEVDIGEIRHKMKPLNHLGKMSGEVASAIFKRANMTGRFVREGIEGELGLMTSMLMKTPGLAMPPGKAAFLDMDGTLVEGRFILCAAEKCGAREQALRIIFDGVKEPYMKANELAGMLSGMKKRTLEAIADSMPLSRNARSLCRQLKRMGYSTVILTDSYSFVAESVKRKVGADAVISNSLGFSHGACNGKFGLNPAFLPVEHGCREHAVCKLNAAMRFCSEYSIPREETIAIGDSGNDACILRWAGESVAFCSTDASVKQAAKHSIGERNFAEVISLLGGKA